MSHEAEIDALRDAADKAETTLRVAVMNACTTGPHHPVQHRDRKPPWCRSCGRTARGVKVAENDA